MEEEKPSYSAEYVHSLEMSITELTDRVLTLETQIRTMQKTGNVKSVEEEPATPIGKYFK